VAARLHGDRELQAALERLLEDEGFRARLAFAALDVNGDGVLARRSLRLLLFHWGRHQPMATELLSIVEGTGLAEQERDGLITFEVRACELGRRGGDAGRVP